MGAITNVISMLDARTYKEVVGRTSGGSLLLAGLGSISIDFFLVVGELEVVLHDVDVGGSEQATYLSDVAGSDHGVSVQPGHGL